MVISVVNKSSKFIVLLISMGLFVYSLVGISAVYASTVSESFVADRKFEKGTVVSVKQSSGDSVEVELANIANSEYVLGVVNDVSSSSVSFQGTGAEVSVALDGEVQVLVSNANGDIAEGDFIGASWLEGVGMRATTSNRQKLVGIALSDFSSDSDGAEAYGEIDTDSGSKNIHVGSITIRLFRKEGVPAQADLSQSAFQNSLESALGRNVSLVRMFIGSLVFVVSLVVAGLFISSAIKGSFISIGRNPMASQSIHKGLVRVSAVVCMIVIAGAGLSYLVFIV